MLTSDWSTVVTSYWSRYAPLTRSLMMELRSLKDLQHDHIVRFLGACLEQGTQHVFLDSAAKNLLKYSDVKMIWTTD